MILVLVLQQEELKAVKKDEGLRPKASGPGYSVELNHEDFYFPSADLLTAQVHAQKINGWKAKSDH